MQRGNSLCTWGPQAENRPNYPDMPREDCKGAALWRLGTYLSRALLPVVMLLKDAVAGPKLARPLPRTADGDVSLLEWGGYSDMHACRPISIAL